MVVQTNQIAEIVEVQEKIDLREMDEEQFVKLFEYLRERTNGFEELPPELIVEDSRYLLLLRLCLGLSQKEFAEKLGVTKDWARHTEAGRRKILHLKIANRYVGRICGLLNGVQIAQERALENFRKYKFARDQDLPEAEIKFKIFLEMGEEDFKRYFRLVSRETEGFTKFEPRLLSKIPQSMLILRIILGIDHRKFAALMGTGGRTLRAYEHLEMRIKPKTATKFIEKIRSLFNVKKVSFTDALENFRWFRGIYGRGTFSSYIERGLKFAESLPPNALEKKIQILLKGAEVPFEMHARVQGLKRDYNVDFAIPNARDPKVIIEAMRVRLAHNKKNYRPFICLIDHRFQMIKVRHPSTLTVLAFNCEGLPLKIQRTESMIQIETLNTDAYILKEEELTNLINKIKQRLPQN